MQPADVIVIFLGITVAVPLVAAVLSFMPNARVRKVARSVLAAAWVACGAAVIACVWMSGRKSAGIGNHIFLLVAAGPAILGFIWFVVWRAARRHDHLQSLSPEVRRLEEVSDIQEGLELLRRELREKRRRRDSWLTSSSERARLHAEISLLEITLGRLEAEHAKRT
jgi:hypothetical protein